MGTDLPVGSEGSHELVQLLGSHVLQRAEVRSHDTDPLESTDVHERSTHGGCAYLHRTVDRGHLGARGQIASARLRTLPGDLDDEDRPAYGGYRVRSMHLEGLAGLHALLGDPDGDLARLQIDYCPADFLRDGEHGELTDGDDGPTAHEDLDDRLLTGIDAVLLEDAVAELERKCGGGGGASHGGLPLQRRDDSDLWSSLRVGESTKSREDHHARHQPEPGCLHPRTPLREETPFTSKP